MHELEVRHLVKRYGRHVAVDGLSFQVAPGRVTGFLGPNGSGKSTTLKVLLDLASADRGEATIGGRRYRDLDDPTGTVGAILEPNAFHPARSGRDHLLVLADATGARPARVDEVLEHVGLTDAARRRVGAYSLGMRQRLGIATAILKDPAVLVLDEPANGLDPEGIRWLRELLRAQAAEGRTVLVSSHLLGEMELLADDLVVIHRGRLVASGTMASLRTSDVAVRTPAPAALRAVLEAAGGTATVEASDGALHVRGLTSAQVGDRALAAGIAVHELTSRGGSLEATFLEWTSSAGGGAAPPAARRGVAA